MSDDEVSGKKLHEDSEAELFAFHNTHRQSSLLLVMKTRQGSTNAQVVDVLLKVIPTHLTGQSSLDLVTRDIMSSCPTVDDMRSAPDATDTSDDDDCQGHGKEAGTVCPSSCGTAVRDKVLQLEKTELRNKRLSRDGEVRHLLEEECKMRVIM
jgi:hypothetical protein